MKRLFASLSAAFLIAIHGGSAHANEISKENRAQVCMPCCYGCFDGFYVGGNLGAIGYTSHRFDADAYLFDPADFSDSDITVTLGVQLGYDWQFCNRLFGLVVDWNWSNAETKNRIFPNNSSLDFAFRNELDWFLTIRGRTGLVCDCSLFYITAGAVVADIETRTANFDFNTPPPLERFRFDRKRWGLAGGVGAEFGFFGCFSANAEILYFHFARDERTFFSPGLAENFTLVDNDHAFVVRVGVNYRFCLCW